jgi:integrase
MALTKDPLQAMVATCTDGLIGLRDAALLSFGFASGGRRRSEITAATVERLRRIDADTYLFQLTYSKTNQTATDNPENYKPIAGPAAHALTASAQRIERAIRGDLSPHSRPRRSRASLGSSSLADRERRAQLAGLDPALYGAHSLRSSFVTESGHQNVPMKEAMTMTGHRSIQTVLRTFNPAR